MWVPRPNYGPRAGKTTCVNLRDHLLRLSHCLALLVGGTLLGLTHPFLGRRGLRLLLPRREVTLATLLEASSGTAHLDGRLRSRGDGGALLVSQTLVLLQQLLDCLARLLQRLSQSHLVGHALSGGWVLRADRCRDVLQHLGLKQLPRAWWLKRLLHRGREPHRA